MRSGHDAVLPTQQRRKKSGLSIFRTLFILFSTLYGLAASLFLAVRLAAGEALPIIALINLFLPILLIPSFILLPINLLLRGWTAVISLIPPVLLMVISYGGSFLPKEKPAIASTSSTQTLSVLTYNLHAEDKHLDDMIALIRSSGADVIGLQEVSYPMAQRLGADLIDIYPYQNLHPMRYANAGQGVLSRYPILTDEYWRHRLHPDMLGHMKVTIDFKGTTITVYNTHPLRPVMRGWSFDDSPRRMEIADLLQRTTKDTGPIIIVGDFNMPDQTDDYRRLAARFGDTYREVGYGLGLTWPDSNPATPSDDKFIREMPLPFLFRLDYVWHNSDWQPLEAQVWPTSGGSDHHPVFVRLALNPH